jgi:hypothetical protein
MTTRMLTGPVLTNCFLGGRLILWTTRGRRTTLTLAGERAGARAPLRRPAPQVFGKQTNKQTAAVHLFWPPARGRRCAPPPVVPAAGARNTRAWK